VTKHFVYFAIVATVLAASACGGREVEIISSSTTAPSTSTPDSRPSDTVVSGAISAIDPVARTIVVNGSTVSVPAATRIDGGRDGAVTFADLAVGWTVTIYATRTGSTVTATTITVDDRGLTHVEIDGHIAALKGTCPAVTFTVGAATVVTTSTTGFSGTACAQLANGDTVLVDGTLQADNSISASRVVAEGSR